MLKTTLVATLLISTVATPKIPARAENEGSFPPLAMLQSGDFVWPKKRGAVVPYNSQPGVATNEDKERWEKEKKDYLMQLEANPKPTQLEIERHNKIQQMTYEQFVALYLEDLPEAKSGLGGGIVSTGHVGIIRVTNGTPSVVEAMLKEGVREIPFSEWIKKRTGDLVWLGRMKGLSAEDRGAIAEHAAKYLKRPYNFWNFDLEDSRQFYCSKLAWLSIFEVTKHAPDDISESKRLIWFSPKQLMHSKHVELLFKPADY